MSKKRNLTFAPIIDHGRVRAICTDSTGTTSVVLQKLNLCSPLLSHTLHIWQPRKNAQGELCKFLHPQK